ncbi:MAG TPA: secondary thiamine-phosphate synthase enzyme YjbQ [Actinomycetota bacterium]|nr:secondary thiamine-phosphate synthase enzyme YjbQ [Actinomycetota bacterium]
MISITSTATVRAPRRLSFVDLTPQLEDALATTGLTEGLLVAFCRHTTCGLLVNEWEDGAQEDLLRRLALLVPDRGYFAHDDLDRRTQNLVPDERANGRAHVVQMLLGGSSQVIPVSGGIPLLGRWQRLFLLELDEPKDRSVVFQTVGSHIEANDPDLPRLNPWTEQLERSR